MIATGGKPPRGAASAARVSAGLLVYRGSPEASLEVFLVHPGGPLFANKDEGAWSIPKGLMQADESPAQAAQREFEEEVGQRAPPEPYVDLGSVKLKSGKTVLGFAASGEVDPAALKSNTFSMQWPPRSGRQAIFPEVDRGDWFGPQQAKLKLNPAQNPFIDRLMEALRVGHIADEKGPEAGQITAADR